eukprot:1126311-Rhodomonas_salina.1
MLLEVETLECKYRLTRSQCWEAYSSLGLIHSVAALPAARASPRQHLRSSAQSPPTHRVRAQRISTTTSARAVSGSGRNRTEVSVVDGGCVCGARWVRQEWPNV